MTNLCTEAWLLRGISSIPGALSLQRGLVTFTAHGAGSAWPWQLRKLERIMRAEGLATSIEAGEASVVFRWPVSDARFWIPWYYFGGGLILEHDGQRLRFSFGRPANTHVPVKDLANVVSNIREVTHMRATGRAWLSALSRARVDMGRAGRV